MKDFITIENLISIVGAVIAFLSATLAFWSSLSAKKSYKLQMNIYQDGKAKFDIQNIEDCFLEVRNDKVYYFFKIIISNLSDKPTAINNIQLEISHNKASRFIVDSNISTDLKPNLLKVVIPINIAPHNSTSGWIMFEISRNVYDSIDIDTHYILVQDIHGIIVRKEEISVREELF